MNKPKQWLCLFDLHWPKVDWPTLRAITAFLDVNRVDGFILGGDQFDNQQISHHTKGKPGLRERKAYHFDTESFRIWLHELEQQLPRGSTKVWIIGNHDFWEQQFMEESPELEGMLERPELLKLEDRGWRIVPLGHAYKLGKLNIIHGELLTGIGNQAGMYPSRKAVELYSANVLAGHTHAPQTFTKVSPVEHVQKWQGIISPIGGAVNPDYLRSRPTAWLNGFTLVEVRKNGNFNCYPIIVTKGTFSYGGRTYKG